LDLSVVVPLYNERENVRPLLKALKEALDPLSLSYEIIIVDDGSRDGSGELLAKLAAQEAALKVIRFRRNYGQTAGFSAGFDHAQGEVVVTLDADLQNDPQDIPKLLKAMTSEDADIVSGWRVNRKEPFLTRRLPSQLANRLIAGMSGVRLHDYGCSLKAYRREIIQRIRLYGELHRFIPAIASQVGAQVVEIPVQDHPRQHGTSKYGLSRTFRVILDLITVNFLLRYRDRPMQFFGRAGLGLFALAGLLELFWFVSKVLWGSDLPGWTLFIAGLVFGAFGLQAILLGVLAEMLMRTYYETQEKPVYTVRKKIGFTGSV
jgi:glycosyltransferase involved in cell wall biosynthesis